MEAGNEARDWKLEARNDQLKSSPSIALYVDVTAF
jgi:hypothetical protein